MYSAYYYRKNMGGGELLGIMHDTEWQSVETGTLDGFALKKACDL